MFVPGWRNGTGLHTALGYSNPANLINNCHDEIRKASLVQLICPVRRERAPLSFGAGNPTGAMALASPGFAGSGAVLLAWRVRAGNDLRAKGDQVNLSRMGGLAVAAGLATIAAGLVPTVARASAPGGSPVPAVTQYTGTPGVARLVPRTAPAAGAPSAAGPRAARRLPSGHFSATETMPGAPAPAAAAAAAAATSSPWSTSTGRAAATARSPTSSRRSSRRTRGCARATDSCWSRSTRRTASTARTGRRCAARSTSTTCSTRAAGVHQRPALLLRSRDQHLVRGHPVHQRSSTASSRSSPSA